MTYIYNWAIWEYPIQKEIVCMAMNQMAPGMQIFEATVCWKNWAPEADYNQKPPKLKEITVTWAAISVLFLLLPVLLAGVVPRSFGALASLQKPNAAWQSHIVTWHVQTLVGVQKMIKRNTPTAFLWRPDKVQKERTRGDPCKCGHVSFDLQSIPRRCFKCSAVGHSRPDVWKGSESKIQKSTSRKSVEWWIPIEA